VGLGDEKNAGELVATLPALGPEPWMMATLQDQLKRLRQMLQEQASLANA
jgi:hypothetical protein